MHVDSKVPPERVRAGGTVLSLIAAPLTVPILRAHRDGPLRLSALREQVGGAAQTTLRGQVGNLRDIGALERHVRGGMPNVVENGLTEAGESILEVAAAVETWLARAPQGPIAPSSESAKGAIRALVGGWSSTMLRALAAQPHSLTELSSMIGHLSYPAVERRLAAMRAAHQVDVQPTGPRATKPYAVTEWTRGAVGPLVAASRCEDRYLPESTDPLTDLDVEAALLLAAPLVELDMRSSGACLLALDTGEEGDGLPNRRVTGVQVELEDGIVVARVSDGKRQPLNWVHGDIDAWVDAILEGGLTDLHIDGEDPHLAQTLVKEIYQVLSGA